MNRQRTSVRSRGSSSTTNGSHNRGRKVKDCCRKTIAFSCTQVGVGGLIVAYALIGAASFQSIETQYNNTEIGKVNELRANCSQQLWDLVVITTFNDSEWYNASDYVLKEYQVVISKMIKGGYTGIDQKAKWSFPAALLFCLSVITMIGYGNMVPITPWGKGATVIYATIGIPIYVLYFLNMGKVLARTFKWIYTWLHECTADDEEEDDDGYEPKSRKKIVVPSTACLWVISFYILIGTIMFSTWEGWEYLDAVYFCVTSLCKIGFGDFVPGSGNKHDSDEEKQTKLAINFVYMLFGMGIVAMCYNLMREDVKVKIQEMKEDMRLCLEDIKSRFTSCCGGSDRDFYY